MKRLITILIITVALILTGCGPDSDVVIEHKPCDTINKKYSQEGWLNWEMCIKNEEIVNATEYDKTGKVISLVPYVNGSVDGDVIKYLGGQKIIQPHKKGKLNGKVEVYTEGKLMQTATFKQGILNGNSTLNNLGYTEIVQYKNNEFNGKNLMYFNDTKLLEINYLDGQYNGLFEINNATNNLISCQFESGKLISCEKNKIEETNCLFDPICFDKQLRECNPSSLRYGEGSKEQIASVLRLENDTCYIRHDFLEAYEFDNESLESNAAYFECAVPKNGIEAKNVPNGLGIENYDLWIDVYLEKNCTGTVVDNILNETDDFFNRYSKINTLNTIGNACAFSAMCGDNFHCMNNKCVSNFELLETEILN